MREAAVPTSLQIHTLDTLLDELVSGRPIALNGNGQVFQIAGAEARSIFAWYREHRDKWARSVAKDDIGKVIGKAPRCGDTGDSFGNKPRAAPGVSRSGGKDDRCSAL